MPLKNKIIIAAAGSGKTTLIVRQAISKPQEKIAIVTYTNNNYAEISNKFYELNGSIPSNVTIITWFTFLLRECTRPYQSFLYPNRIENIEFTNGRSARYVSKTNTEKYYLSNSKNIYTDKISEFSVLCNEMSGGLVIDRLERIYDTVFVDEVQDLAGWDLELIKLLFNSKINILLVGDNRQVVYLTNHSSKNSKYSGHNIITFFEELQAKGICKIYYLSKSFRCNQTICDLADSLYPDMPKTTSLNKNNTGHDGIFLVHKDKLSDYINTFLPTILRYDRRTKISDAFSPINFGNSKGLTFDRVLILPNGPINKFLETEDIEHVAKSVAKFYVAITRARFSVAFAYNNKTPNEIFQLY